MDMTLQQQCEQLHAEIQDLLTERASLRAQERNLRAREATLSSRPILKGGQGLAQNLAKILPRKLLPGNVGGVNDVAWPFYYPFDFDFGVNPALTVATRQTRQIVVSQEAGFIMTGASVQFSEDTPASARGPYQFSIRDNQSSRQLNDTPIRIQDLGSNGCPTQLYTGYLVLPNASLSVEVSTFIETDLTMNTVGTGRFQIAIHGVRVRVEDFGKVLTTTFQR